MPGEKENFKVRHNFVIDFIFDERFKVHRIILGIILIFVSLILAEIIIKVVLWLLGLMFIMSGVMKSCPIRERIKNKKL